MTLDRSVLKPMPKVKIRCGKTGGLPFDNLLTDVMSGCLGYDHICYGNCTAALFWRDQGYDFGQRTSNELDISLLRSDLEMLPKEQLWLRQGWVSDCSFNKKSWETTALLSSIVKEYGCRLLIITKIHTMPKKEIMQLLADNRTEIRVSLSALDSEAERTRRMGFLQQYRDIGGIAIPYLMTTKFRDEDLKKRQGQIVDHIVSMDYIAAEHPLRLNSDNKLMALLETDGFWHPKFKNQYWFGKVLDHVGNFILPAPTHLAPSYNLNLHTFSEIKTCAEKIVGIEANLPTYEQLLTGSITYIEELNRHAAYRIQD